MVWFGLEKLRVQVQERQEYRRNNMTPEQNISKF